MPIPLAPLIVHYQPPRNPTLRAAGRMGNAIANQVLLVAVGIVHFLARRLWFPTAVMACICVVTGIVFWIYGMWINATECAAFAIGLFGLMAGLQTIERRLYTWYSLDQHDRS